MDKKKTSSLQTESDSKRSKLSLTFSKTSTNSLPNAKSLLASCLPLRLDNRIFKHVLNGEVQSLEAYLEDRLVGVALWGPSSYTGAAQDEDNRTYLYAIAVMATERCAGIGTQLMTEVKESLKPGEELELHVQESNEEVIRFYEENGFVEEERISNFYRRLSSPGAILMCYKRPDRATENSKQSSHNPD